MFIQASNLRDANFSAMVAFTLYPGESLDAKTSLPQMLITDDVSGVGLLLCCDVIMFCVPQPKFKEYLIANAVVGLSPKYVRYD